MNANSSAIFYPSISELKEKVAPKLEDSINQVNSEIIKGISDLLSNLKETNRDNPPVLQFQNIHSESINQIIETNKKFFNSNNDIESVTAHSIVLIYSIKALIHQNEAENIPLILSYINNEFLSSKELISRYEILYPYLYKMFDLSIPQNSSYPNIDCFKNKYVEPIKFFDEFFGNFSSVTQDYYNSVEILSSLLINPISFIHYLEFSIEYCLTTTLENMNSLNLKDIYIEQLFICHKCLNFLILFFQINIPRNKKFNEIMITFLKAFITLSIEIIVNNQNIPKKAVESLISTYLSISFELTVESNEIYIFSLLSSLIIINKNENNNSLIQIIRQFLSSSTIKNELYQKIQTFLHDLSDPTIIEILLIKSIEIVLEKKYNKDFSKITGSISFLNIDDFIMNDIFIYPNVYDKIKNSITNFKQKFYWNLCELTNLIYGKKLASQKLFKFFLLNQIKYLPDCKSLVYNLIQYYYSNRNYRKTKILCKKLLSTVNYSSNEEINKNTIDQIEFEIDTRVLFIYSHINLLEDNFELAKDLCILNLKRLEKYPNANSTFISKNNIFLGFSYAKKADISINYEEKTYNNDMAKKYFDLAYKNLQGNSRMVDNCSFYYAHQLNELNKYEECENYLSGCDKDNQNINFIALKVLNKINLMKYNEAKELCRNAFKKQINLIYLNKIIIMYYYLQAYLYVNFPTEVNNKDTLLQDFKKSIKDVVTEIDTQINDLNNELSQNIEQNTNKYKDFILSIYKSDNLTTKCFIKSKSNINFQIKYLLNIKIEFIKNCYIICDNMIENGLIEIGDHSFLVFLLGLIDLKSLPNDDFNGLLMNGIKNKIEANYDEAENFLKRLIENCPNNVLGLKILANFLLKEKKDLSNSYIYCMKALKLDEQERELWSILAEYYLLQNEDKKYYHCCVKEIENAKYFHSSFLNSLIKKEII